MKNLTVTISGSVMSGKTTLAMALARVLTEHGATVMFANEDDRDPMKNLDKKLEVMKGKKVLIEYKTTYREGLYAD